MKCIKRFDFARKNFYVFFHSMYVYVFVITCIHVCLFSISRGC